MDPSFGETYRLPSIISNMDGIQARKEAVIDMYMRGGATWG